MIEVIPRTTQNIGKQLCHIHASNKSTDRKVLLKNLQNIMFLACQNIALRGDKGESDSNFNQLLHLRSYDDSDIRDWLKKKTDKYKSGEIQNEMLEVMALQVIQNLTLQLQESEFFSIMVDECTDSSNHEQLAICFWWVDHDLEVHEGFLGLYEIPNIAANTIVSVITDTLLRMNLPFS